MHKYTKNKAFEKEQIHLYFSHKMYVFLDRIPKLYKKITTTKPAEQEVQSKLKHIEEILDS